VTSETGVGSTFSAILPKSAGAIADRRREGS